MRLDGHVTNLQAVWPLDSQSVCGVVRLAIEFDGHRVDFKDIGRPNYLVVPGSYQPQVIAHHSRKRRSVFLGLRVISGAQPVVHAILQDEAVHVAYDNQIQESFLDGHVRAFHAIGGCRSG